ncbi:putative kinase domain protein, partial [Yersinia pestis PY-66]
MTLMHTGGMILN